MRRQISWLEPVWPHTPTQNEASIAALPGKLFGFHRAAHVPASSHYGLAVTAETVSTNAVMAWAVPAGF
jgi:hypothetical protein